MPSAPSPMTFDLATRTIYNQIGQDTRTSGGVTNLRVANTGLLARLWVTIRGQFNTLTSGPNAFGQSAIINRLRVQTSGSVDLFNMMGPTYFHLLAPVIDQIGNVLPNNTGRTAIASSGQINLDMVIPVEMNLIDQIGYFSMQNNSQFANFILNWETDAVIATGGITYTTQPALVLYQQFMTVPKDQQGHPILPAQGTLHTLRDWSIVYAGGGEQRAAIPIASSYAQLVYGAGFAATGATDNWTRFKIQAEHHDTIYDVAPAFFDLNHGYQRGLVRNAGVIPVDLYGGTGRGMYGSGRDTINSSPLTDLDSLVTLVGAGTVYAVAREVIPVPVRAA